MSGWLTWHFTRLKIKQKSYFSSILFKVFKFGPYGGNDQKPLIALGTRLADMEIEWFLIKNLIGFWHKWYFRFEPGSDETHYCKPTSVAVTDDGNTFFVSDGYCNSRIIKYKVDPLEMK